MVPADVRAASTASRSARRSRSGPQSSAPLLMRYTNDSKTAKEKMPIATSPKSPSAPWVTAHGYRNTISTSKTMKIIATRKKRTGKRSGISACETMPHS